MGTTRKVDEKLQRSLQEARQLLEEIKRKQAELQLMRQALPLTEVAQRAALNKLQNEATDLVGQLRADMKAADLVARKIEGQVLWKSAVHAIWGPEGLQKCYVKLRELEAQRAAEFDPDGLRST